MKLTRRNLLQSVSSLAIAISVGGWMKPGGALAPPATFGGNPNAVISTIDASTNGIVIANTTLYDPAFVQVSASGILATGYVVRTDNSTITGSSASILPYEDLEYTWNFGDASGTATFTHPVTGAIVNANTDQTGPEAVYCYRTPGSYTITLSIRGMDGSGGYKKATATKSVTVNAFSSIAGYHGYYFDSMNGSNSNGGTGPSDAWADFTNFNNIKSMNNARLYLARNSHWKTSLGIYSAPTGVQPTSTQAIIITFGPTHSRICAYTPSGASDSDPNPIIEADASSGNSTKCVPYMLSNNFTNPINDVVVSNVQAIIGPNCTYAAVVAGNFNFLDGTATNALVTNVFFDNCQHTNSYTPGKTVNTTNCVMNTPNCYGIGFWVETGVNTTALTISSNGLGGDGLKSWFFMMGGTLNNYGVTPLSNTNQISRTHYIYVGIKMHCCFRWVNFPLLLNSGTGAFNLAVKLNWDNSTQFSTNAEGDGSITAYGSPTTLLPGTPSTDFTAVPLFYYSLGSSWQSGNSAQGHIMTDGSGNVSSIAVPVIKNGGDGLGTGNMFWAGDVLQAPAQPMGAGGAKATTWSITGGVMTVSGTTGTWTVGQAIMGTGTNGLNIDLSTTILSFGSGSGGNGTYNVSGTQTVSGSVANGNTAIYGGAAMTVPVNAAGTITNIAYDSGRSKYVFTCGSYGQFYLGGVLLQAGQILYTLTSFGGYAGHEVAYNDNIQIDSVIGQGNSHGAGASATLKDVGGGGIFAQTLCQIFMNAGLEYQEFYCFDGCYMSGSCNGPALGNDPENDTYATVARNFVIQKCTTMGQNTAWQGCATTGNQSIVVRDCTAWGNLTYSVGTPQPASQDAVFFMATIPALNIAPVLNYKLYRNHIYNYSLTKSYSNQPTSPCPYQITDNIVWDNRTIADQSHGVQQLPASAQLDNTYLIDRNQYYGPNYYSGSGTILNDIPGSDGTGTMRTLSAWKAIVASYLDVNSTVLSAPPAGWPNPPTNGNF